MNQINLTDENSNSFAVKVDDKDLSIPDDLGTTQESAMSSFEIGKYKNWLFVLGGTILVFIVVLFLIKSSNSKLEERLESAETEIASEVADDEIPSFFMGSLANLPGGEAPTNVNFEVDENLDLDEFFGETEGDGLGDDVDPLFGSAPDADSTDTTGVDDPFALGDNADTTDETEDDFSFVFEEETEDDEEEAVDPLDALFANQTPTNTGPSLNSNTMPETLLAGEMQGDTGPAFWLALIPAFAYASLRRRRS